MPQQYALLNTKKLGKAMGYDHPILQTEQLDVVDENSSALEVFTDFQVTPPQTTTAEITAHRALDKMKAAMIRSLLVINSSDQVIGLISSSNIQGIKLGKLAQENGVCQTEVTVEMAMTSWLDLLALNYKDLSNARVGHIKRLLHELGVQHLLVTKGNQANNHSTICGIFSATRVSKQLGEEISGDLSARDISHMYKDLGN